MRKTLFLMLLLLMLSSIAYTAEYTVVTELFSTRICEYCPFVQAEHERLFSEGYRTIPLYFYDDFPLTNMRNGTDYATFSGAVPLSIFGGTTRITGSAWGNVDPDHPDPDPTHTYVSRYDSLASYDTPFTLTPTMYMNDQGRLQVDVTVGVDETLMDGINTEHFVMNFFLMNDIGEGNTEVHTSRVRFRVIDWQTQPFDIETTTYSQEVRFGIDWELPVLRAVVMIQDMEPNQGSHPNWIYKGSRKIHQAAMTGFESGPQIVISPNLFSGPPQFTVSFTDRSSVPDDPIVAWAWDFNNDDSVDSTDEAPRYTFDGVGFHDVKLTITTESGATFTKTFTNMIEVQSPDNVSGIISGNWVEEYSPYTITGNISIPAELSLTIQKGVTIKITPGVTTNIEGNFQILGGDGEDEAVIITSTTPGTTWNGFRLMSYPGDTVIQNAIFEHAATTPLYTSRPLIVKDSIFRYNEGGVSAGAINLSVGTSLISGCFFSNNNASGGNSSGAVTVTGNNVVLNVENSIFVNNTGTITGTIRVATEATLNINNSTFYNNQFNASNGGVIQNNDCVVTVTNSIIDGPFRNLGTAPYRNYISYSRTTETSAIGDNNITDDPMFVNPSEGNGRLFETNPEDWRLLPDSPCIDAGNPDTEFNDFEDPEALGTPLYALGTLRNDMGAYGGKGYTFTPGPISENNPTIPKPLTNLAVSTYPNPFNPIMYVNITTDDIHKNLNVSVYNIKGQRVAELMNDRPSANNVTLSWNGKDAHGTAVGSGIYFVRVNNENAINTKKVLLLK